MSPHPARLLKLASTGPFDYPTKQVGVSSDGLTTVYYDPSLALEGANLAIALLAAAPDLNSHCAAYFGISGAPTNLIIAPLSGANDGRGGAYHYGCDWASGGTLYVDAAFGNAQLDAGLYVAELTECFMGVQAKGWNCGGSGGEALSRFLAEAESGGAKGALAAYASAPAWDQAGRPDWISRDQGSDQDYPSIGCGLVYLSWMRSLGHSSAAITQGGGATLAENFAVLTGKPAADAWTDFSAATATLVKISDDDPFGTAQPQPKPPAPTQAEVETAIDSFASALKSLVAVSMLPT